MNVRGFISAQVLFYRLILRPLLREPLRTALIVFSVALGVAVVIAIDMAGQAAGGSFESSVEALSGKATLTITAVGGIDERLLGKLVQLPLPLDFIPRIEDFATPEGHGAAVPIIGLDLISQGEGNEKPTEVPDVRNPIFAGSALGWKQGQVVSLTINDRRAQCTVAGVLPKRANAVGEDNAIVADIGLAQELTGKKGKLDAISVLTPSYGSLEEWKQRIQQQLPPSLTAEPAGARTDANRKMLAAFRWNLRVLSYIALVVGAFLIYNTVAVSVVRRRSAIGILRAIGMARLGILAALLAEAAVLGTLGSVLGLALGRVMASGAVQLIGNTVEMLYVSGRPAPIGFTRQTVIAGIVIGVGVSLLAALAPAWEASRVAPIEAIAQGRRELAARLHVWRSLGIAVLFAVCAIVAALQPAVDSKPLFGYLAALLTIGASAAAMPVAIAASSHILGPLVLRTLGVESFYALRNLYASLNRTSILAAALTTAIAMLASVGIMVGSFRDTVALWMANQLRADLYLRPAGSSAADRHPTIAPAIADDIERLPGVEAVDRFRVYAIQYDGLPASLGGGETAKVRRESATYFLPGENRDRIMAELPKGDNVIVSEPFANKHHVRPGDTIALPLGEQVRQFHVLGIYYDYSTERGFIIMDRATLLHYLPDRAASNLAVYLKPGADVATVHAAVDAVIAKRSIMVFTNSKLRHDALTIFDRTFAITWALEVVAIVVAVVGIAGALLAMVMDRRRHFAVLRFIGGSRRQVRKIIVAEAGILSMIASAAGLVMGTALSLVLIYVINKQSFGWTIQFHWPVGLLLTAIAGVNAATLLAGLYPARVAVAMDPIAGVYEE